METKQKELLIKIKNLINSNNKNESKSAERFLNKLLKKYNISLEELESELTEEREIKFKAADGRLISQIIYSFIEKSKDPERKILIIKNVKTKYFVNLTNEEYIELVAMIEFFLKAYKEEFDIFYFAFLFKQDLLLNSNSDEEINQEQKSKYRKAIAMSSFINNHIFRKQIENKED